MKFITAICLFFLAHLPSSAQEMSGIVHSNYSGIFGISLNPSYMVGSRLYMDFNLLSANAAFTNNYVFIERKDYTDLLLYGISPSYFTNENEERNFAITRDNPDKYGYYGMRITGPSAMIVDGYHAYGITTCFRANAAFHNLPIDMSNFLYEAIDYDVQHGVIYNHDERIQTGILSWFEIGLTYAYNFQRYKWDSWTAGITIKPLLGYSGTYTNLDQLRYIVYNDTVATVYSASFGYGYSLPMDYYDNSFSNKPFIRGFGLGADIGVTYARTAKGHATLIYSRLCEQRYERYNFKLGISLLDFGYIKFTKNAICSSYTETSTEWFRPTDTLPESSPYEIEAKIAAYFKNNSREYTTRNDFVMNTPPSFSVQFDHCVKDYLFVNTTVIWGFNLGRSYMKRQSVFSVTPRFETARLECALPISVYEWNFSWPHVGLAVRYGNFFIGTDRISTIIGFRSITGFDIYAGLRLNLSNTFRMNFIKEFCGMRKFRNIEMFDYRNF
jgi:hypothetical protein